MATLRCVLAVLFCVAAAAARAPPVAKRKGYDSVRPDAKQQQTFGFRGNDVSVSALTALANLVASSSPTSPPATPPPAARPPLGPRQLIEGLRQDFARGYLFSGDIDANLYDENCVYTDPTLSFKGLSTFQRNIRSLKPLIDLFVGDNLVTLYSLDQKQPNQVTAKWRMEGSLRLPWRPVIDVQGVTTYSSSDEGGRVCDYAEQWTTEPTAALLQLLKPAAKKQELLASKCQALGDGQQRAVLHQSVVESMLALSSSSGSQQAMRALAASLDLHDTVTSADLISGLAGTRWRLAWTDSTGGSSGQLGPVRGAVSQRFDLARSPDGAQLGLVNSVALLGGALEIELHAVASEGRTAGVVDVAFMRTDIRVFGVVVKSDSTSNRGFWRVLYADNNTRVFTTNAGSLFVLVSGEGGG